MRWAQAVALLAMTGHVAMTGCSNRDVKPCGLIPDGGCPVGRGGTCDDATCPALYDCVDGSWTLHETCDAGQGAAGGGGAGQGGAGAGGCVPATIDRTGEADGCVPELQEPDCPAAVAETCQPCTTGCVDFFLCRDDGWESVGFCDEDGNVIVEP